MSRMLLRLSVALTGVVPTLTAQYLVVVHKDVSTVGIYSLADGVAAAVLPTGNGPHEVAVSADGKLAVVTDYGAQQGGTTLTVIDIDAGTVARTISLPYERPHGAQFLPDHRTVAVSAERDGLVLLVNATTGDVVSTHPTTQRTSHMVALSPDGKTAYTANIGDGSLSIVPLDGSPPFVVRVSTQTEAIAVSPDGRSAWLGSNNTGKVFVVDLTSRRVVDSAQTAGWPYRIAFTPDSRLAIVTNPQRDEVQLIDARTRALRITVKVGSGDGSAQPFGIAVAPSGDRAWITLRGSGEVVELGLPDGRILRRFATGSGTGPDGIGYAP